MGNTPENPIIPAEFGEVSSGSKDQYHKLNNNNDRNQINRPRNNDRNFKASRNFSRGEYPKDNRNKYANTSHTRQHYSRNNSRSHSRERSTDFKHRSYSRACSVDMTIIGIHTQLETTTDQER